MSKGEGNDTYTAFVTVLHKSQAILLHNVWHLQAQLLHLPTCQSLWLTFLIVSTLPRINIKIISKSKLYRHSLGRQKGGGL